MVLVPQIPKLGPVGVVKDPGVPNGDDFADGEFPTMLPMLPTSLPNRGRGASPGRCWVKGDNEAAEGLEGPESSPDPNADLLLLFPKFPKALLLLGGLDMVGVYGVGGKGRD